MKKLNLPTSPRRTSTQIFGLFSRTLPIIGAMALADTSSAQIPLPEETLGNPSFVASPTMAAGGQALAVTAEYKYYPCMTQSMQSSISANVIHLTYPFTAIPDCSSSGVVIALYSSTLTNVIKNIPAGEYHVADSRYDTVINLNVSTNEQLASLSIASQSLIIGQQTMISSNLYKSIEWNTFKLSSSNPMAATVSENGVISAANIGTAIIYIKDTVSGESAEFTVIINEPLSAELNSMYLADAAIDVNTFTTIASQPNCNCVINWGDYTITTSDPTVAKYENGYIKGISAGSAKVIITKTSSGQSVALSLNVSSRNVPSPQIGYCVNTPDVNGLYSVQLSYSRSLHDCKSHILVPQLVNDTIYLATASTREGCAAEVFTDQTVNTSISDLPKGVYYVAEYGAVGQDAIKVVLGDTLSLSNHNMELERYVISTDGSTYIRWGANSNCPIDWTKYTITSSNSEVATSNASGQIKGIAQGTSTFTVTEISSGKTTSLQLFVMGNLPMYFGAAERYVGDTIRMETCPACKDLILWDNYSIISSDPAVAKPIGDGKIVGVAAGTATITLTSISTGSFIDFTITFINKDTLPVEMSSMYLAEAIIFLGNTTFITWDAKCKCQIDWTKYTITTSYPETATVTATGQVTGVAIGEDSIIVTEISSGKTISLLLTVVPSIGGISLVESMYFESNSIVLGSATRIKCEQSAGIDWSKYTITATSGLSVTADGIVRGLKAETGSVTIMDVERKTVRTLPIRVTYNFFDVDHVEMYPGDTVNVPINRDYAEFFNLVVVGDYFKFDAATFTATTDIESDASIMLYYKSDNTFAQGLKFLIKEKPVVTPPVGDASVLADMYLGRESIVLGDTTNFFCKQNVQIDWSKFDVFSSDGPTVKDGVVSGCKTHEDAVIVVTHIATKAQRKFVLNVHYDYFTTDHVEMKVGDTVKVPVNPNYAEFFYLEVYGADYFKFDEETMTATATAVGDGYAGVLCYYKSDSSFAEGIKFLIKEKPVVETPVGDVSVLADMYLGRESIALGDTTNFFCKQNVQIDWSKFDVSSYDGPTVKDGVVSGCKTHEDAVIIVTHIATKAQRKFVLNVHYDYFTTDHVEMKVGDTVKVPVNPNYAEFFYLEVYGADYFKFDEETMTATATAVGDGYAGVLCYYKSDSSFAEGIKFAIKDTASVVVKPTIKAVKLLNGGYTLEITFDAPVELYPGIEADFMVAINNALKASGTYTVTKVMAKEGNPNTLVLIMDEAVPVNGFTVQYKTSKAFAVATSVAEEGAESAVIYPNPAQNSVTFSTEGLIEATISTISGQLLIGSSAAGNQAEINISHLPAGQYIATFITDNGTLTQMLTVK